MPHKFDVARAGILDSEERKSFQNPEEILKLVGIESGIKFADVGCGTGYFSIPAAKIVGKKGKVYAVDIERKMLSRLGEKLKAQGVSNIQTVLSTEEEIPLHSGSIDFAFMANTLHELQGEATLKEVRRTLRKEGTFAVVEWKKIFTPMGPPLEERLSPEEAAALLQKSGFRLEKFFEAGPYHYALILRRG